MNLTPNETNKLMLQFLHLGYSSIEINNMIKDVDSNLRYLLPLLKLHELDTPHIITKEHI